MAQTVSSSQAGFMDISPVRRDVANKENDTPVLSLIQFSKAPFVSFGSVKLGTSRSALLRIENPVEDVEADVTVEKIPSSKGFSVDHNTFTIEPEGSLILTVTWTPTEEGGIRELITFNANGVLKHQAVLLGRAEALKRKKKSLWDTIKNKGDKVAAPSRRKTEQPLKMSANKTFQVSRRTPRYTRDKPRSPLASLNVPREAPRTNKTEDQNRDQENLNNNVPLVLLIPAAKSTDSCGDVSVKNSPEIRPESKDLTRTLNRTRSPVGTPERFKKLMPHIHSDSPLLSVPLKPASLASNEDDEARRRLTLTPVPSLRDALALIDSDISPVNASPPDSASNGSFSDSLENGSGMDALPAHFPRAPEEGSGQPRLTFLVVPDVVVKAPPTKVQKAPFTSATVTKSRASAQTDSSSARKIKKSRRRLLERTLELCDSSSSSGSGSRCESGPHTPSLPVIETDTNSEAYSSLLCATGCQGVQEFTLSEYGGPAKTVTFPVTSPPHMAPSRFSFSPTSSSLPRFMSSAVTPPSPMSSSSPASQPSPSAHQDAFPIVHASTKSKKRKSEEHQRSEGKTKEEEDHAARELERVKRSRTVAMRTEYSKTVQERRRGAGSVSTSSVKSGRSAVAVQAKHPSSKLSSRGAPSLRSFGVSAVKSAKLVAVAQSKLTFMKPAQTAAIPRHPMPFAAKNMFYDERWMEKQERGFTWWLNYVLTPDDFKVNTEVAAVSAVSIAMGSDGRLSVPRAPTREELSFSTYTARRKLNLLRGAACSLFTSQDTVRAIQRLELEVEAKRLLVRKDRHLWKDIGQRRKVLNWLLSYNPLWLRIGLETIYGELISLESNSDTLGLAMFILHRLLWNPDIAAHYKHPKVNHCYKDGHEEALSRFTLKKLLLLVCFLDKAKESRLIEHNPCLFCLDAEFKTSKDLLLAFSRDFLSGEGILPRHLGYLGLAVSHVQTPLDEFNFAVKNLAVDLKCGIRLVRVLELLVQDWSLSAKLRLPAISRLQKIHNVDLALRALAGRGVDLKDEHGSAIDSRDIVDGHREKTLSLLWKLILTFHVEVILEVEQLTEEIGFLKRTLRTKRRLASLRADRGPQPGPPETRGPYQHSSSKISLLMDWVRAVCDFYRLEVENFTVAFSDGRVLCHLIHHYHPSVLPLGSVSHSTTQTQECAASGRLELHGSASDQDDSFDRSPTDLHGPDSHSVEFKELLKNEKNNFRLVNTAVSFLGGVPAMINPADMSNTIPSEKVVMSYLSFLCDRLLDLRNETRAARAIQGAWRKYRLKKDLQLYKERSAAAVKLQSAVRGFLQKRRAKKQNAAAAIVQSAWRGYAARNALRLKKQARLRATQHKAATVIQAHWRMCAAVKAYQRLRHHTVVVQAQWRMRSAACAYGRVRWAAAVIQRHWRARAAAKRDRERYISLRTAAVKIQRGYRTWKSQRTEKEDRAAKVMQTAFRTWYAKRLSEKNAAAVRIQSWYKMHRCLRQYRKIKRSAVLVQARYRGHAQRRRFQTLRLRHHSAVIIQSGFRGLAVRKQVRKMRCAAVTIQRRFRASLERDAQRETFVRTRCAAITIQAAYRGKVARDSLRKRHEAATAIQAAFRKTAARRRYRALRTAAAVVQQRYRATVLARKTKRDYDALRNAALTLQAQWRGRAARKSLEKRHRCATLIQAYYRQHRLQAEYRSKKAAAVVLQRHYRAHVAGQKARKAYLHTRASCITIQAGFRGMKVRAELRKKHQAATVIEKTARMFLCRKRYYLLQSAAIVIQSRYRALRVCRARRNEYRELKQATVRMQAVYRGCRVREELKRRHSAATAIQAQFRMHRMRMAFLATKCAAYIVQDRFRAKRLGDQQRQRYRTMKSAAVLIQAAYRGHRARRQIAEMHRAATVIQRKFLAVQDRNRFRATKAAALVCQRRYRAAAAAKRDRLDYLSKRGAVVTLQAAYRGYEVRRRLRVQQAASVTIQSHFRRYRERVCYLRLKWAANVFQTRYRANKKMRREMETLRAKRNAAVALQAAFRGMKSRLLLKNKHRAASVIQRAHRAHRERKQYLTLRSSVLTLQRRYRATVAAKEQMQEYQNMRSAAIMVQAAFRGQQVRKEVARRHWAATVIQSVFRKHREEVKFQAMRVSAIIIQRHYRSCVLQRRDRERFLKTRRSAVVLQAAFRGHRVRANVANMHRAATVIQASYRSHKQRSAFRRQRWAVCVLQQRFRAQRQRNTDMKHYQQSRAAAIVLQTAYRGMKSRQVVKQRHRAASVVQRAFRAHREHKQYLTLRSSVLTLQRRYRATVAAKKQMQEYQNMRSAAIMVQAAFRGQQVRKEVARLHRAATVIQSVFRKHREEVKFQAMRLSAIIIQRHYRSCVLQRRDRERFLKTRRSAVVLQAAFRGHRVRANVANMHRAATAIQASFRSHKQRSAFRRQRWAACVLQQRFRAQRQRNTDMKHYQQSRAAAIVLQAAYRGMKCRRIVEQKRHAASVIQRAFRAHSEHKQYLKLKSSVLAIQRKYRANVTGKAQRTQYQNMRSAAITVQAAFRGQQVRKEVARRHRAATVIQSVFRKHREEVKFQAMRLSAIIIQRHYRSCVLQRRDRERFLKTRRSAVVLQAAFRGHRVRANVANMHRAATVIQASYRSHKQRSAFRRQRWAVCVLQQRFRAQRQRNTDMKHYQQSRAAAIVLQAAYRGMKSRQVVKQRHRAASVVQRAFRAHREHKQYLTLRSSVLTLQRRYRATVAAKEQMQEYQKIRSVALVLQAALRGQQVRKEVARRHRAATVIQSVFRKHREEVKFQAMRVSAIIIQRHYRSCVLQRRDRERFLKTRRSAVVLQAAFRGHRVRASVANMHSAAIVIQASFRSHKQRSAFRRQRWAVCVLQQRFRAQRQRNTDMKHYQKVRSAVINLQAAYRGMKCRRIVEQKRHAASVIQRAFRARSEHKQYLKLKSSVLAIQRKYRANVSGKAQRTQYQNMRSAAIMVQAAFRGQQVRKEVARRHRAATVIQSVFRKHREEVKFQAMRLSAIIIQRHYRSCVLQRRDRERFLEVKRSAIVLQTHCRAWIARRQVLERAKAERRLRFTSAVFHHLSAVKIQRALRAHWALESAKRQIHSVVTIQRWVKARQQRTRYLEERRKVCVVQRVAKRWLRRRHEAASVIQRAVGRFLFLRRQKRVQQGIIKAQALWRGHRSRRLNDDPRLAKLRRRLSQVSAAVREEDKLGNKTSLALDYLLRYKHFSYILEALKNLETATRLSPECCERLVESGATQVIFTLIRCCNRSVPCMDVITFSVQILLNLSKYHKTIEAVYSVESSVETLLDLLQRYREKAGDKVADKGGSIFTKACFLLALLLQDRAVEVMKLPKLLDRIRSIYRLTARKHKMDAERTVIKQKMNASVNGSFYVPATPRKSRPVPKFAPEWVLRKDKLKDIVDPLRAIQMVANTLSIVM